MRQPWDLRTALTGAGGRVQPGDTVWVRGGTYRGSFESRLRGAMDAPVVVRNYHGERAIIDHAGSTTSALYVTGDKTVLENVRLHGFQDTLFADTASDSKASRVYVRNSFVEGDTDFIFGGASLVIDSSWPSAPITDKYPPPPRTYARELLSITNASGSFSVIFH